ncbi:MAG: three-Cys-motif partner protein TcmP [bacterium]|nr:three-Cys-motif partner protein TcmP [bacterium]
MLKHQFGGDWTEEKLSRVKKYLPAYTTIFKSNEKARHYTTTYVDAFAGTGYVHLDKKDADETCLIPELLEQDTQDFLKGSAAVALETEPAFDRFLFIEKDMSYAEELNRLKEIYPQRRNRITIVNGDANDYLKIWCQATDWTMNRAVVFLDPYGMQVEWSLLETIADTRAIDLWILFPLGAAMRFLQRKEPPQGILREILTRMLGTEQWIDAFYKDSGQMNLLGEDEEIIRAADFKKIASFFVERLETIFPGVVKNPLQLKNTKNVPLYLLCFATANPKRSVIGAALRISEYVLRS